MVAAVVREGGKGLEFGRCSSQLFISAIAT